MRYFAFILAIFLFSAGAIAQPKSKQVETELNIESIELLLELLSIPNDANDPVQIAENLNWLT